MRFAARSRRWGTVALAVAALGCAGRARAPDEDAERARTAAPDEEVVVVVENRNSSDVVVTVQAASGRRLRLGSVTGSSTRALRCPPEMVASQPLTLLAHPIGARETYTSDRFTAQPGQRVVLTVASRLAQSSVSVH